VWSGKSHLREGWPLPLRYFSDDKIIEVIVDPDFPGDLQELAETRVVWMVDTPGNRPAYEAYREIADQVGLCEVNRYIVPNLDPNDREHNLINIVIALDTHYYPFPAFVVHGLVPSAWLTKPLAHWGFRVSENTPDGFVATAIEKVLE
jgi:hypothetical protein